MKLLFLTDKFIPERGGSQIIFSHLYTHLTGPEVTVITRTCPGDAESDRQYPHRVLRVPYLPLPKLRSLSLGQSIARKAAQLAAAERFDMLVCGQPLETAPFGLPLARRLGIPCIVHTFAEDVTSHLHHPIFGPLVRSSLRSSTVVTTISRYTRDHLLRLGVQSDRIIVLYPGVIPDRWGRTGREAGVKERFGLAGRRVLITVSRLIPRKGHDVVLKALPEVRRAIPDLAYLIVGDGPEEGRLRQLSIDLGLEDVVRFAGSVPNTETVDYYHASDAFAMPNRRLPNGDIEGFGLVFLEANVCGLPVIGGRSGGAVDAIEHGKTGWLVEPTSVEEVAGRILDLLGDGERARAMGEAGKRRVLEQFTWAQSGRVLGEAVALASRNYRT